MHVHKNKVKYSSQFQPVIRYMQASLTYRTRTGVIWKRGKLFGARTCRIFTLKSTPPKILLCLRFSELTMQSFRNVAANMAPRTMHDYPGLWFDSIDLMTRQCNQS